MELRTRVLHKETQQNFLSQEQSIQLLCLNLYHTVVANQGKQLCGSELEMVIP